MTHRITFRPGARSDLFALYDYIAERAGLAAASGYLDRIEAACLSLRDFPERGTQRHDIVPGLRTIGFERRTLIAFRIVGDTVEIVAVLHAGRQLTPDLADR